MVDGDRKRTYTMGGRSWHSRRGEASFEEECITLAGGRLAFAHGDVMDSMEYCLSLGGAGLAGGRHGQYGIWPRGGQSGLGGFVDLSSRGHACRRDKFIIAWGRDDEDKVMALDAAAAEQT